jgi:hypothetical protein
MKEEVKKKEKVCKTSKEKEISLHPAPSEVLKPRRVFCSCNFLNDREII